MPDDDVVFLQHEPCPSCGSKDNLGRYSDGHGHCFGCGHYEHGDGTLPATTKRIPKANNELIGRGDPEALIKRGISRDTCIKFGYTISKFAGKTVQVAAYKDSNGQVVAQKLRFPKKGFTVRGDLSAAMPLWGQWLWRDTGRMVVITEGEIDAMSVSQMQGNKWPVVSVPNGASGAAKSVAKAIEWLTQFDSVVFLFDDDPPGREAVEECVALLPPGRAKIATIPGFKDANAALQAGEGDKIIEAIWGAKAYRPDGIVRIEDLADEACLPIEHGLPWWLDGLTEATYGRRPGELYAFGAGTGVGKTDFLTQQAAYDATVLGEQVGLIYLEMPPVELARRIAGKTVSRRFHLPVVGAEDAQAASALRDALRALAGKVAIYDHFGETDWEVIESRIRYMVQAEGIKLIYLDHLTAMADPDDERASLETIMKEMAGLAQELKCIIHFVSHLATPDGKPHEEGGRVMIRHFKGARAIGFWSYFMFGMERDQQADDIRLRKLTTFRILKDRFTGQGVGRTFTLSYNTETGLLFETDEDLESDDDELRAPWEDPEGGERGDF